ncbi:acid-sensing ion channel 1C-like isoform X1 [Lytechinus variegatus]|uniref:acid-sensing ion channel 1C-like isoform X1 n=1 Tax=Lytechinus variegatus TaxID=7654 RepID=UPI001BB1F8A1|nr:acid-sensing ion channel 1C-like isoform X1 [Lytechinus variegatus]
MPSRVIHVSSAPETDGYPRMAFTDPEKGIYTTEVGTAGPLPFKGLPPYKDKVTWIAVVAKGVPDTVSVSGLKYLFNGRENRTRRMVWSWVISIALGVMTYQVFDRCVYYSNYPKSVDVEINYVSNLTFPSVAICNYNSFRRTPLEAVPEYRALLTDIYQNHGYFTNFTKFYESGLVNLSTTDLHVDLAHKIEDSFVYGFWGTELLSPANFSFDIFDFGVCFTFNTGKDGSDLLMVETSGKLHGLGIILDAQQWDYFYSSDFHRVSSGFQVMVYDRNEVPLVSELGFAVGPGTENLVGLEITEVNNLPPPHGVCGKKHLKYYDHYSTSGCRQECHTDFVIDRCGCKEPYMPGNSSVCNPVELYDCAASATVDFIKNASSECECPVPCHSVTYEPVVTTAGFPSHFWAQTLAQIYQREYNVSLSSDYFSENMLFINLFFKELSIEKITQQKAYTFFSLLCDIGGSMGLWLGGSILTFFELFDLLSNSTYFYYTRLARRK